MKARITVRSKGRLTVQAPEGQQLARTDLEDLAHYLREVKGVKRSIVRGQLVFIRINEGIPKVRESIVRKVKMFFMNRYRSLGAQSFKVKRSRSKRPTPAYVQRRHRQQHIAIASLT